MFQFIDVLSIRFMKFMKINTDNIKSTFLYIYQHRISGTSGNPNVLFTHYDKIK